MKITAVYECEISGGLNRLLIHIIKNWPDINAEWTVLCHRKNSGIDLLKEELHNRANIKTYSEDDWGNKIINLYNSKWFVMFKNRKIVKRVVLVTTCLNQFFYFIKYFSKNKPDIIYLQQGGYPGGYSEHVAGMAAKIIIRKIKVIMSIQNIPAMNDKRYFFMILDWAVNHYVDFLVFASKYTVFEIIKKTKLLKSKMHIINEGVTANIKRIKIQNNNEMINIGMIGSFEPRKGHRIFFDAIKILKNKKIRNFKVHCFGQSKYGEFNKIVEYAKQLDIYELISWHEYETDFDKLYGPLDIIVYPSIGYESMPLVPIDAAAYYKPVIASRLQGLIETIQHEITGYLIEVGDSIRLAYYLEMLILNPGMRSRMGDAARKRFLEKFTATRMAQEYYKIFIK